MSKAVARQIATMSKAERDRFYAECARYVNLTPRQKEAIAQLVKLGLDRAGIEALGSGSLR